MTEKISEGARAIMEALGEAYLVGGAVRDLELGRPVHDEDLCSPHRPEEVPELLPSLTVLPTGLKHGTVTVLYGDRRYELTTYRVDGPYLDARHPESVRFSQSLEEDLARRDFTINAMAMDREGTVVDPFGGREDLERGLVRAVGDPEKRFEEDALRILRGVRFANRLGFSIEAETEAAMRRKTPLLQKISRERIAEEFLKILCDNPAGVTRLHELGILAVIYPVLDEMFCCPQESPWHLYDVGRHAVKTAEYKEGRLFRVAALLHDVGKPQVKTYGPDGRAHFYGHAEVSETLSGPILRDFFLPGEERRLLLRAVALHDFLTVKPNKIRRMVREEDEALWPLLFDLKRADVLAQSPFEREMKLELVDEQEKLVEQALAGPHRIQDLVISGRDLVALGYRGPKIGAALEETLAYVMEDPLRNEREGLLSRAERMLKTKWKNPV